MTSTPTIEQASAAVDRDLVLAKWLRRLEDPNRRGTYNRLRRFEIGPDCYGMCAMGELADTFATLGIGRWEGSTYVHEDGTRSAHSLNVSTLCKYLKIPSSQAKDLQDTVVRLNDNGGTIQDIVDYIRTRLGLPSTDTSNV